MGFLVVKLKKSGPKVFSSFSRFIQVFKMDNYSIRRLREIIVIDPVSDPENRVGYGFESMIKEEDFSMENDILRSEDEAKADQWFRFLSELFGIDG